MDKRDCTDSPWRASRGGIAAVAVIVFLTISTRPVFAELASLPGAGAAGPSDIATLAIADRNR